MTAEDNKKAMPKAAFHSPPPLLRHLYKAEFTEVSGEYDYRQEHVQGTMPTSAHTCLRLRS